MHCSLDRFGFPYLRISGGNTWIGLLPVTKFEFEQWLACPEGYGDDWYREVLTIHPRVSWRQTTQQACPLGAFLGGVLPGEMEGFTQWLGNDVRLPTAQEWQTAYNVLDGGSVKDITLPPHTSKVATHLWGVLSVQGNRTLRETMLMSGGFAEWVVGRRSQYGALGRPQGTLWSLGAEDPVIPILNERDRRFGFRLIASSRDLEGL